MLIWCHTMTLNLHTHPDALAGRVAVLTGGAGGVAAGITEEFTARGATVVLTGRNQASLDEAAGRYGPNCIGMAADVTREEEMAAVYERVVERFGRLDIVIANAVIGDSNSLGRISEAQFDRVFGVNVKGVLFTVQPALRHLPNDGSIVIIGSTASIQPPVGMSLYGGAKAALRAMIRAWIQEVKGTGVRINILSLGAVDTPSLRTALADAGGADNVDASIDRMGAGTPLGRLLQPREAGASVAFLASSASSAVTGVELFADGGMAQTG